MKIFGSYCIKPFNVLFNTNYHTIGDIVKTASNEDEYKVKDITKYGDFLYLYSLEEFYSDEYLEICINHFKLLRDYNLVTCL